MGLFDRLLFFVDKWLEMRRMARRFSRMTRQLENYDSEWKDNADVIRRQLAALAQLENQTTRLVTDIRNRVHQQNELTDKMKRTLDETSAELKIASEVTIPGLVKATKTFETTWDAESARMSMQAGALSAQRNGKNE